MRTRAKNESAKPEADKMEERDVFDETMFDAVPCDEPEENAYSDLQYDAVSEGADIKE